MTAPPSEKRDTLRDGASQGCRRLRLIEIQALAVRSG
jgi:hypothetical protein